MLYYILHAKYHILYTSCIGFTIISTTYISTFDWKQSSYCIVSNISKAFECVLPVS